MVYKCRSQLASPNVPPLYAFSAVSRLSRERKREEVIAISNPAYKTKGFPMWYCKMNTRSYANLGCFRSRQRFCDTPHFSG